MAWACVGFLCAPVAAVAVSRGVRAEGRTGPVEKVVNLLKDLKGKIEQDGKSEQQVYDKYACWCEKASSAKASAIETAQKDLRALGQDVLKYKGEVAVLEAEMTQLQKDMDTNKAEQAEATSIRQRENAAFAAETAEMKEALAALQKAVIVLRKATTLVQVSGGNDAAAAADATAQGVKAVEALVQALPVGAALKPAQTAMLSEFVSSNDRAKYAPQSNTVQGILTDMYETFSSDVESATQAEASANTVFEEFIAIKTEELKNLETQHAEKASAKADAEQALADTTQSYDDTEAQMKADIKFFDGAKQSCETKAAEWKVRSDLRTEELRGIREALVILTSDASRKLFKSSIKAGKETGMVEGYDTGANIAASLLQVDQLSAAPTLGAYAALKAGATQAHSVRLAMLAAQVREAKVGHFDKVLAAIDSMAKTLQEEDAADIAKRDQCKEEYKNIESTVANVNWLIEKNVAKIDKLQSMIEKRQAEREQTIEDIASVTKQIAEMTADRTAANGVFKNAKAEDQDAIALLVQARGALSSYYGNNSIELGPIQGAVKGLSLASTRQGPNFDVDEFDAPDADFSGKGKRKNESKGIVSLLTSIIEDLNDEIKNGMRDEEAAQLEYEELLKAAEDLKAKLEAKKLSLEDMIAAHGEEKSDEHQMQLSNEADRKDEKDYKASIKTDCDWIIKAFEERAAKRQAELAGLTKAKEFLAGYNKAALVETKAGRNTNFDDAALAKLRFLGLDR